MDNNYTLRLLFLTAMAWIMPTDDVVAQSVERSFQLQPGWNSVYLEVDPVPETANELFAGLPIQAVWMLSPHRRSTLPPECIDTEDTEDPSCMPIPDSGWRVWFPPDDPRQVINSLRIIPGGRVYLVQAGAETSWTVIGKPDSSKTRWGKGYNLVGFHVTEEATAAPTFRQYLSGSAVFGDSVIYEINEDGGFARITEPASTRINPGRGYWVSASAATRYDGPLGIDEGSLRGITLAAGVVEHSIEIKNLAASSSRVTIRNFSGNDSASRSAAAVGGVPLVFMGSGDGSDARALPRWRPLQQETWTLDAAGQPQSSKVLRVAMDRGDLAETSPRINGRTRVTQDYTGLLVIENDAGFSRMVSLTASGGTQVGLWVGQVTVDEVEWIMDPERDPVDPVPTPTSSEFTFRIIVHNSGTQYTLLREATLAWEAGRHVLVTNPTTPECQVAFVNDESFFPRVSTAAFSFPNDIVLQGDFNSTLTPKGDPGVTMYCSAGENFGTPCTDGSDCPWNGVCNELKRCDGGDQNGNSCATNAECPSGTCLAEMRCVGGEFDGNSCALDSECEGSATCSSAIVLGPDDPLNPFRHQYHPDHESGFRITRDLTLTFKACPENPASGATLLCGTYDETIRGLHQIPINARGPFELRKISDVDALCGGR